MRTAGREVAAETPVTGPFCQGLLAAVAQGALTSTGGRSDDGVVPVRLAWA